MMNYNLTFTPERYGRFNRMNTIKTSHLLTAVTLEKEMIEAYTNAGQHGFIKISCNGQTLSIKKI